MMLDLAPDPVFPALSRLTAEDLRRIAGCTKVEVLRTRHQPGTRAVLHIACGAEEGRREGVIWFLWPEKIDRLCLSQPGLRVDPVTGAAFEAFPNDHRMPELARFLAQAGSLAPRLIGAEAAAPPALLRYRPGLSATFRWQGADGGARFVKVARKADVAAQAATVMALVRALGGTETTIAPVAGLSPDHATIAYHGATGTPFDRLLSDTPSDDVTRHAARLVAAIGDLNACRLDGVPVMDRDRTLNRARRAAEIVATADPVAGAMADKALERAAASDPMLRMGLIHADMKLDHGFADGTCVTFIDTESLHLGDPDHDLALLDARLDIAVIEGHLSADRVTAIRNVLRAAGGPNYDWFLSLGRIHAAKYFAQRNPPDRASLLRRLLSN